MKLIEKRQWLATHNSIAPRQLEPTATEISSSAMSEASTTAPLIASKMTRCEKGDATSTCASIQTSPCSPDLAVRKVKSRYTWSSKRIIKYHTRPTPNVLHSVFSLYVYSQDAGGRAAHVIPEPQAISWCGIKSEKDKNTINRRITKPSDVSLYLLSKVKSGKCFTSSTFWWWYVSSN